MKRLLVCLILAALLLGCVAAAEPAVTDMVVVNCEEWVSLRAKPSASSKRLAKVPLDSVVTNCARYDDTFTYCEYLGQGGYILTEYLEALPGNIEDAFDDGDDMDGADYNHEIALDRDVGGVHILAVRDYGETEEVMSFTCTDSSTGETLWTRTISSTASELTATAALIGGTAESPALIVGFDLGLAAVDPRSGEVQWTLAPDQSGLSNGGLSFIADGNGTLYVGGYYGPDPVAISAQGKVLWRSNSGSEDIFWLYELRLQDGKLAAHYDHFNGEESGWVAYDAATGAVLATRKD